QTQKAFNAVRNGKAPSLLHLQRCPVGLGHASGQDLRDQQRAVRRGEVEIQVGLLSPEGPEGEAFVAVDRRGLRAKSRRPEGRCWTNRIHVASSLSRLRARAISRRVPSFVDRVPSLPARS